MRFDVLYCREGTQVARGKQLWGRGTGVVARTHGRHQENHRSSRFRRTPDEGWWVYTRTSNRIIGQMCCRKQMRFRSWCKNVYLQLIITSTERIQITSGRVRGNWFYPIWKQNELILCG